MKFIINEKQEILLKEYLDKEYNMPLYKYLKNGERYSNNGHINLTEKIMPYFLYWIKKYASDKEFYIFKHFCDEDRQLSKYVKCFNMLRNRVVLIGDDDVDMDDRDRNEEVKWCSKILFKKLISATGDVSAIWDNFYNWLENNAELTDFRNVKDVDADVTYMNPSIHKKNGWLVHMVSSYENAYDIMLNGFQYGLTKGDMDKLNYSNKVPLEDKEGGNYSYAYDAEDIIGDTYWQNDESTRDMFFSKETNTKFDGFVYRHAVQVAIMFQASGVKAYHFTDRDEQVIFNNKTANNFVLLARIPKVIDNNNKVKYSQRPYDGKVYLWSVVSNDNKPIYQNESFTKVVAWVVENYSQYKNKIGNYNTFSSNSKDTDSYSYDGFDKFIRLIERFNRYDYKMGKNEKRGVVKYKVSKNYDENDEFYDFDKQIPKDFLTLYMQTDSKEISDEIKRIVHTCDLRISDEKVIKPNGFSKGLYCFKIISDSQYDWINNSYAYYN